MTDEREIRSRFVRSENRMKLLAHFMYFLTMAFRDFALEPEPKKLLAKSRAANELLHVVSKQMLQYQGVEDIGYPEDAFMDVLQEFPDEADLTQHLSWAMKKAVSRMTHADSGKG